MTRYTLTYEPKNINFRPATVLEEIYQNINTILSTYKFTVPLFREFGFTAEFIDRPLTVLLPVYVREVVETIEKYEQRVLIEEVKLNGDIEGKAYPTIIFTIRNGVKL